MKKLSVQAGERARESPNGSPESAKARSAPSRGGDVHMAEREIRIRNCFLYEVEQKGLRRKHRHVMTGADRGGCDRREEALGAANAVRITEIRDSHRRRLM
jgi:hypothetical protein